MVTGVPLAWAFSANLGAPPHFYGGRERPAPPQPSQFGVTPRPKPSRLGAAPQKDEDGTPQPFTIWSGLSKRTRIGPQPFCNLEPLPERTGIRPPTQSFTICQLFPCRRLTADFLLPNSVYKLCHLHWAVGRSRGWPHRKPNPERDEVTASAHAQDSFAESPHALRSCRLLTAASTTAQKPTASSDTHQ